MSVYVFGGGWTEGSSWPVMGLPIACEWYLEQAMANWSNTETLNRLERSTGLSSAGQNQEYCFSVLCNRLKKLWILSTFWIS